jgi:hypothetical protein
MPILKVLVNPKGEVVGTADPSVAATGTAPPTSATLVPRPGQRLIEVNVDESVAGLDPAKLHVELKSKYVKPTKTAKGKTPKGKGK